MTVTRVTPQMVSTVVVDLATSITAAGSDDTTLTVVDEQTVSADVTIPSNVYIQFLATGSLAIDSGKTVTFYSPENIIASARQQLFSGAGSVAFTNGGTVFPEWWGVDGTADEVQIRAAGDSLPDANAGVVQLLNKTYTLAAALSWTGKSQFEIRGMKGTIVDGSALAAGSTIFTINGSASGDSTTASAAISKMDNAITVTDETGFASGKMITIKSTEYFSDVDTNYLKGEIAFIASTAANTINVTQTLKDDYSITAETVTITEVNHIENLKLTDFEILGGGGSSEHIGVIIEYARDVLVENVRLEDVEDNGIVLRYTDHGRIKNGSVIDTNGATAGAGYSYQFGLLTQHSSVEDCYAENTRHLFTTTSYYPVWDFKVTNCTAIKSSDDMAAYHTHNNGTQGVFSNNYAADFYIGIQVYGPGNLIQGNTIHGSTYAAISVAEDGGLQTEITGNKTLGRRGVLVATYSGTTDTEGVLIEGNFFIGDALGGSRLQGTSSLLKNTVVKNNYFKNHSPAITLQGNNSHARSNDIIDPVDDTNEQAIYLNTTGTLTGVTVKNNHVWCDDLTPEVSYAITVSSGVEDAIIEDNIFEDHVLAGWISDSGTRTRVRRNTTKQSGTTEYIIQKYRILGTTSAGCGDGTTAGKALTGAEINYEINGRAYTKAAADNLFDLTGVTTGASEYKKVLLCLNAAGTGSIVEGVASDTSQTQAEIPEWWPYNVCPVGIVELGNSYGGGDLAGHTFYDFIGQID